MANGTGRGTEGLTTSKRQDDEGGEGKKGNTRHNKEPKLEKNRKQGHFLKDFE